MLSAASALSPGARNRGRTISATTASRTVSGREARPSFFSLIATAISRNSPLKSGISSSTCAVPPAPSFTRPENRATVFVGTTESARPAEIVAAFAQTADGRFFGFDQPAVIVMHADAEPALAEIIRNGIRRSEIGELKNSFVDGGERQPRRLSAASPVTVIGMAMCWRGAILPAPPIATPSVFGALSTPSHVTPIARTGSRPDAASSGR